MIVFKDEQSSNIPYDSKVIGARISIVSRNLQLWKTDEEKYENDSGNLADLNLISENEYESR
jgi:hypothetical protein